MTTLTFVDVPVESFSVDTETRTITGLALPYGQTAKGVRFEQGSLQFSEVSRVKLNLDHDPTQTVGVMTMAKDTPSGMLLKFRVAKTPEGDRALALASEGIYDGLSVGVDFDTSKDTVRDPEGKTGLLVKRADLRHVALTPEPAFDDARVTHVAASNTTEGVEMTGPVPFAAEGHITLNPQSEADEPEDVDTGMQAAAKQAKQFQRETPAVTNPVRPMPMVVNESLPYRFDRKGNFVRSDYDFSTDLVQMLKMRDMEGNQTAAGKRVMGMLFSVITTSVDELNPTLQRPDLFVDQRDFRYPVWESLNKGAPPNGVQPFAFPKYNSSSGLVGNHTEGTEPTPGAYDTAGTTVTPTALSGKINVTREVWDMGGNPAISTLLMRQMQRAWFEGLETAAAAYLNTLAPASVTLVNSSDANFVQSWTKTSTGLQFTRGYDFNSYFTDSYLFTRYARLIDGNSRPIYPITGPVNANGQATSRFQQINANGYVIIPSWALNSTAVTGSANSSWLYDSTCLAGWATAPQFFTFEGTGAAGIHQPVASIDLAIWGYKAFTYYDLGGVRKIQYTPVSGDF